MAADEARQVAASQLIPGVFDDRTYRKVNVRASYGTGPVGTGAHLMGYQGSHSGPQSVEAWFMLSFFPLIPLGRWRVAHVAEEQLDEGMRSVEFELQGRLLPTGGLILRRVALAIGIVAVTFAPIAFGVRMIGEPWATDLLSSLLGQVPEVLTGLGKLGAMLGRIVAVGIPLLGAALELGIFLGGAALPILVLMRLDEQTPRVGFRTALSRRAKEPAAREDAARQRDEADEC